MLDPHLLQSFVAIVETGSFTRAGERMHLTQSTISQQMRRLEQQLGCPLLDRSGRQVVTTAQGETLLGLARRILGLLAQAGDRVGEASLPLRLGVPEDFAAGAMTAVLAAFARQYPEVRLEVQSDLSHALWQAFEAGELDLALIKQGRGQGEPIARWREPLAWVDSRDWPAGERDPVPLVVFPSEGLYRRQITDALDARGIPWRIAYVSASLASLQGAVSAGIGVSLLPTRLLQPDQVELTHWPSVRPVELALHLGAGGSEPLARLCEALITLCDEVMGEEAIVPR
ncbi:MAG: LysR family transcriptional regulator [Aeromonas sp.]|uniref:LysR family transcriptional regulator n=2 Tax=Aeromonas TaxID=642 RepID=A0AAX3VZG1_AERSA|nr:MULTISPECIES: LysR family transcriptional regulator [Aeromonas]MBP6141092.1 LysR family transcriptional regulator [Aeromonas sp.]MBJ7592780.1 LysR family transcriptional regulator [Aeromonas veronii]MBP8189134.1 LysR family transcriptional regulator [Aeromonas sp.]MDX7649378.1 LysR family transcriptional regulator [Aeromonas caviae]POV85548.1 LysR family transcriptional regulator [Aeromonas sp. ASNIH8]